MKKLPAQPIDIELNTSRHTIAQSYSELKALDASLFQAAYLIRRSRAAIEKSRDLLAVLPVAPPSDQAPKNSN